MNTLTDPLRPGAARRLLDAVGAPQAPTPTMDRHEWALVYAAEMKRLGSQLPCDRLLQQGLEVWVTEFPADARDVARDEYERLINSDTVPAFFTSISLR